MSEHTNIEWCDSTFNPWLGCTKVSPGCDHCYAERSTPARTLGVMWGWGEPRRRTGPANWALPKRWNAAHAEFFAKHGRRQRVFCASLADVFDNDVAPAWRVDLFQLIEATPQLDWLLLTKRIGNAARMFDQVARALCMLDANGAARWPANVWLGTSVVNQAEAYREVPKLLAIPARVRWLSLEPLLGPVTVFSDITGELLLEPGDSMNPGSIDWIVAGGESGPNARPMHPAWACSLRDQCAAAGVPFLFKQWGEWCDYDDGEALPGTRIAREGDPEYHALADCCEAFISEAGDVVHDVADIAPDVAYRGLVRPGKKAAGRRLDGVLHSEWPL